MRLRPHALVSGALPRHVGAQGPGGDGEPTPAPVRPRRKRARRGCPDKHSPGCSETEGGGRGCRGRDAPAAQAQARDQRGGQGAQAPAEPAAARAAARQLTRAEEPGAWDSLLFTSDNRLHAIVSAASLAVILSSGSHTCKPRHQMVRKQTDSFPVWVQGVCADQHLLHH